MPRPHGPAAWTATIIYYYFGFYAILVPIAAIVGFMQYGPGKDLLTNLPIAAVMLFGILYWMRRIAFHRVKDVTEGRA